VTMQLFVREHCMVIAAPVQCDVDRIPKGGSHYARIPPVGWHAAVIRFGSTSLSCVRVPSEILWTAWSWRQSAPRLSQPQHADRHRVGGGHTARLAYYSGTGGSVRFSRVRTAAYPCKSMFVQPRKCWSRHRNNKYHTDGAAEVRAFSGVEAPLVRSIVERTVVRSW